MMSFGDGTSLGFLILMGFLFHSIYVFSIFDIYFKSPLVNNIQPVEWSSSSPCKRVVLIVADGLRADKIYEMVPGQSPREFLQSRAPFLRSIINERGSFGVSHTRVPTESRPGHVALIAGFYEDVSAVTHGWKLNPVQFDSLFNQSHHTWSFGSPDILPMFKYGSTDPSKIDAFMYNSTAEDFSKDGAILDKWVFDRFDQFLTEASSDVNLYNLLMRDKLVFFFHLLGIDSNGHSFRPYSVQYLNNIKYIDSKIKILCQKLERFYKDNSTAYIFTADHGMSNLGSHGDGNPDNTRTPLIAWGSGISRPSFYNDSTLRPEDTLAKNWNFGDLKRKDVQQADIAPLMAYLSGINIPVNSVGILPLDYLDLSEEKKKDAIFTNAQQLFRQYKKKEELKKKIEIRFQAFPLFKALDESLFDKGLASFITCLQRLYPDEKKASEVDLILKFMRHTLEGDRYLQTYDWFVLRLVVALGYLGWIFYSSCFIVQRYTLAQFSSSYNASTRWGFNNQSYGSFLWFLICLAASFLYLFLKSSPRIYYLYFLFPIYFWTNVLSDALLIKEYYKFFSQSLFTNSLKVFFYGVLLELLVLSFHHPLVLTGCFIGLAVWPFFFPLIYKNYRWVNGKVLYAWSFFCILASVFPLLSSIETKMDMFLLNVGAFALVVSGLVWGYYLNHRGYFKDDNIVFKNAGLLFIVLIISSCALVNDDARKYHSNQGLFLSHQILGWTILGFSSLFPFFIRRLSSEKTWMNKLFIIYLAFGCSYILLSVSYEILFYCFFGIILNLWIFIESNISLVKASSKSTAGAGSTKALLSGTRALDWDDMRIAIFFIFFINSAFFCTGNIASLSSFRLDSIYRFLVVFNPFTIGALLIYKLLIPLFLLSSVFGVLSILSHVPRFSLFLVALSITDIITLNFFFLVKDYGSWLEIGLSISHFCITNAFILLTTFLFVLSNFLIGNVDFKMINL